MRKHHNIGAVAYTFSRSGDHFYQLPFSFLFAHVCNKRTQKKKKDSSTRSHSNKKKYNNLPRLFNYRIQSSIQAVSDNFNIVPFQFISSDTNTKIIVSFLFCGRIVYILQLMTCWWFYIWISIGFFCPLTFDLWIIFNISSPPGIIFSSHYFFYTWFWINSFIIYFECSFWIEFIFDWHFLFQDFSNYVNLTFSFPCFFLSLTD